MNSKRSTPVSPYSNTSLNCNSMIVVNIKKSIELSKTGKPFARVLVQFEEYKDGKGNLRWISGFGNKRTWAWKVGDDVQPSVEENGNYLNFSFEDTDENRLDVYRLPATIGFVMDLLKDRKPVERKEETTPPAGSDAGDDIKPDDIPF